MQRHIHVLIVEDDQAVAELLKFQLSSSRLTSITSEVVSTLGDASARIPLGGIDCVLLDLRLPNGEGTEVVRRIDALTPDVPIVVLSAMDFEVYAADCVRAGATSYLEKGNYTTEQLIREVRLARPRMDAMREAHQMTGPLKETIRAAGEVVDKALGDADHVEP